jgi:hypothetical protein
VVELLHVIGLGQVLAQGGRPLAMNRGSSMMAGTPVSYRASDQLWNGPHCGSVRLWSEGVGSNLQVYRFFGAVVDVSPAVLAVAVCCASSGDGCKGSTGMVTDSF